MPKPLYLTLYQFGIDPSNPSTLNLTPTAIATEEGIRIEWASWCDLIYTFKNTSLGRSIVYTGTSLSPAQREDFVSPQSIINQALTNSTCGLKFFGSSMHDGARGYICKSTLRIFSTPAEDTKFDSPDQEVETWDRLAASVRDIQMCTDGSVLVCLPSSTPAPTEMSTEGSIVTVPHPKHLSSRSATTELYEQVANFIPTQLVTNATTTTALSSSGQVYTWTTDPRYPSTLGRPYTGTPNFEPVPYLSETRIKKIASGGYMTAAISEDGELFLWGQSNPGTEEELGVLHRLNYDADAAVKKETVVWGDSMQDDDVKVLNIFIDGKSATAYDVAVGFGHVLVAAEAETGEHVVFAAGCGSEGQLGTGKAVPYEKEFIEVTALREKHVVQLGAAGWSSFIVTYG